MAKDTARDVAVCNKGSLFPESDSASFAMPANYSSSVCYKFLPDMWKSYNCIYKVQVYTPSSDVGASGGTLEANANNVEKYTAQMTLSAASPAAKIDGETPKALAMAT